MPLQLLKAVNLEHLTPAVIEFIVTKVTKLMGSRNCESKVHQPTSLPRSHESIVLETLSEVMQAAEKMSLPKVYSMIPY